MPQFLCIMSELPGVCNNTGFVATLLLNTVHAHNATQLSK